MLGQYVPLDLSALDFLQIVIGAMTAAIAGFAALLLLSRDHDARMRTLGLALFFLATAVSEFDELYMHAGGYALFPWSIALAWPLIVIIGPAILLYVRDMTAAERPPMTPVRFARYAWPVPAGYLIALPFFLRPGEEKLAMLAGGDVPATFASAVPAILGVLFLVIALASLVLAFRGLLAHMRSLRNLFANIEDKSLNWVRAVLLVLSAAWIWGAASTLWRLDDQVPQWQGPLASILEMGWVFAFAFFGIRQGEIFPARTLPAPAEAAKYTRSALDAQRMDRIAARIETAMREQHLYRNPALSLRQLSDTIRVSQNYISQTLNDRLGRNFFDYVNAWRIADACRRLGEGARVLDVAHETGFNSRSTFNAAFRKHTGTTPSAWRRQPAADWPDGLPRIEASPAE